MRERVGNPSREAHNQPMRVYDWIAPAGTDPMAALALMEAALPGIKLFHRGDFEVHGFVNTARLPDTALYVAVHLYDVPCADPACMAGHGPVAIRQARVVTPVEKVALQAATGEHASARLRGTRGLDRAILESVGFTTANAPLRDL